MARRPKIIKLLKGNIEGKLHDTAFSNDMTAKARAVRKQINGRHQNLKLFCTKRHYQ